MVKSVCLLLGLSSTSIEVASLSPPPWRRPLFHSPPPTSNLSSMRRVSLPTIDSEEETGGAAPFEDGDDRARTKLPPLLRAVLDKVGKIDEARVVSAPQYWNGEEPTLVSHLHYHTLQEPNDETISSAVFVAQPKSTSILSSSALLCGTALGAGILSLPSAIHPTAFSPGPGYLPSIPATLVAWAYMTISALLTSELIINRWGETGRITNSGMMDLYLSYLGPVLGRVAGIAFLLLSYLMIGVYLSEGADSLLQIMDLWDKTWHHLSIATIDTITTTPLAWYQSSMVARAFYTGLIATFLASAVPFGLVPKIMTNYFFPATLLAIAVTVALALPSNNVEALLDLSNQQPEAVLNAFPLLFLSWTYHGVLPRVVYNLEGDKKKITIAIVAGSTTALIIYLIWNTIVLGNILGQENVGVMGDLTQQSIKWNPSTVPLQSSLLAVTALVVTTSLIGVVSGYANELYDAVGSLRRHQQQLSYSVPREDEEEKKLKLALLTLLPLAVLAILFGSLSDQMGSNILESYPIMEFTGTYGASVLYLILPALMVWKNRYGDEARPLTVSPMFPFGKLTLGSLYKAAGTLIVEQGLEKLGVFEFIHEYFVQHL